MKWNWEEESRWVEGPEIGMRSQKNDTIQTVPAASAVLEVLHGSTSYLIWSADVSSQAVRPFWLSSPNTGQATA